MKDADIDAVIKVLRREVKRFPMPVVGVYAESNDPFIVLISTVLSLRTKDPTTFAASERLFKLAATPRRMLALPAKTIETAIYPVSFFRVKARSILRICADLIGRFDGKVPDTLEDLLSL